MYSRIQDIPNRSFFLFGPRGTGKTTWIKKQFPKAVYIDLLRGENDLKLSANPSRLEDFFPLNYDGWVLIDEVQRIPSLLNEVHRIIESRGIKFVLTGSSARKLRSKGTNLLAGRALTMAMFPLTAVELSADFQLEKALERGLVPTAYLNDDYQQFLQSYIQTYLKEEVLQEGLTRNLGAFARFLETASFFQGSVLNVANVAREANIGRKVVENYFSILEDLLIGVRLQPFVKRARRRVVAHAKFYYFDVGVYKALRPKGPLDSPEEIDGIALETLVFQDIRACISCKGLNYDLFFWRTPTGIEVDFVLYGERGFVALEVKRTARLRNSDFRGLKAFRKDYPAARTIMLYGGNEVRSFDNEIEIIPTDTFLRNPMSYI